MRIVREKPGCGRPRRRNWWVTLAVFLLAAGWFSSARGQTPPGPPGGPLRLSLAEAVQIAVTGNFRLQSARLSVDSVRLQIPSAEAAFQPTLTLTGTHALTDSSVRGAPDLSQQLNTTTFGPSITNKFLTGTSVTLSQTSARPEGTTEEGSSARFTLSVTQPLLKGAGIEVNRATIDTAKNNADIAARDLERQLIETASAVENAYLELLLAIDDRKIREQALEGAKQQREANRFLIEVGRLPARELAAAEAAVSSAELDVAGARNTVENARRALLRLLNLDPVEVVPTDSLTFTRVAVDPAAALGTALQRRSQLIRARLAVDNARIGANTARNSVLYDLSLTGSINSSGKSTAPLTKSLARSSDFRDMTWNVGATLTIPLDNAVARNAYLSALNALRQAELELKDTEQGIRLDLDNALKNLEINAGRVAEAERGRTGAEERLETETVKFREGRATNADIINARRDLVTAHNALLRAIVDYQKTRVDVEQARGTTLDRWNIEVK